MDHLDFFRKFIRFLCRSYSRFWADGNKRIPPTNIPRYFDISKVPENIFKFVSIVKVDNVIKIVNIVNIVDSVNIVDTVNFVNMGSQEISRDQKGYQEISGDIKGNLGLYWSYLGVFI